MGARKGAASELQSEKQLRQPRANARRSNPSSPNSERKARPRPTGSLPPRIEGVCPFGDHTIDATQKEWPPDSGHVEWLIGCFSPGCPGRNLPELAEALDLPRWADKDQIAAAIYRQGRPSRSRTGPTPELPDLEQIEEWHALLLDTAEPLAYLIEERSIGLDVIVAERVGFDGTHLVFPMLKDGELVALKRRLPQAGQPMLKPFRSGGWSWPLYPDPDTSRGCTFLTEGEIDGLRLRSEGLPATSVTGGVEQWRDEWAEQLIGTRVVVMFDVGFHNHAKQRAQSLREAGVSARAFDLRLLDMTRRNEDVSDYLDRGGSPERLRRVLNPARRLKARRSK